jgi:nucleoside-diphosphate-sugar epimerase
MERIFITGATGCVGQYVIDELASRSDLELHALVRPGAVLRTPANARSQIVQHVGSLESIRDQAAVIGQCEALVHIAAAWEDGPLAQTINVDRTLDLVGCCDPLRCRRLIVVSTASVLGPSNQLLDAAQLQGTAYVRSKHLAYRRLVASGLGDRLVVLFPTLVFGGDGTHRLSHIVRELAGAQRYLWLAKYFSAPGSFHFIHARDVAVMVGRIIDDAPVSRHLVCGQPAVSFRDALSAICGALGWRYRGAIALTPGRVLAACRMLGIRLSAWDRHSISHPHFTYDVTRPDDLGATSAYPTLAHVLADVPWRHSGEAG